MKGRYLMYDPYLRMSHAELDLIEIAEKCKQKEEPVQQKKSDPSNAEQTEPSKRENRA